MKKGLCFLGLLLLFGVAHAEMQWFELNPTAQAGNCGDSGQVISRMGLPGSYNGFEVEIKIVDSSAGTISDDSSCGTWYTNCINTEDVFAATGLFQVISITDTSTATGHLFDIGADSTYVWYVVKTGYVPYDPDALTLITAVEATTVTGTAIRVPITLTYEGDEGVDSLFNPFTWMEITVCDSTRWGEKFTQDFAHTGSGLDDGTVAGTYTGSGELGRFHITIFGSTDDDPDSIIMVHYGDGGHVTSYDTTAITGSAQDLDSGMTINFNAVTGHTDDDVFVFHVSDSLHYGKTIKCKIRAGLNVHRR